MPVVIVPVALGRTVRCESIVAGWKGVSAPVCTSSEIGHHGADLQSVDRGVIPAATVRGLPAATIVEHCHQVLIGAAAAGSIIEGLIILNPEGNVPGLPVCPTVESGIGHRCRLS